MIQRLKDDAVVNDRRIYDNLKEIDLLREREKELKDLVNRSIASMEEKVCVYRNIYVCHYLCLSLLLFMPPSISFWILVEEE